MAGMPHCLAMHANEHEAAIRMRISNMLQETKLSQD